MNILKGNVKKVSIHLMSMSLLLSLVTAPAVSYADTQPAALEQNQGTFTLPPSQALTGSHTVSFDHYSLMIDGKRTFIYSGEFDYWRLPSQSEWLDVLQKMKSAGFNAVSIYFNWNYHSPAPGQYDFTGVRDVDKLLTMAQQAGIYVIARPGPYINAETDGGGFPGWLMTQSGRARSSAADYTKAYQEWMTNIDAIIAKHQITNGGSVILYEVENEYTGSDATYMQQLGDKARKDGINVPLFHNDKSGPRGTWSSGVGAPDMYAFDSYPSLGGLPNYYGDSHTFAPNNPVFVAELGGGWFDPWGGKGFPALAQTYNANYENIIYNHVVSQGATMMSIYMTYGGTNWGYLPFPGVYSSYDYTAAISESRQIGAKYNAEKLLATMYQTLTPLTKTDSLSTAAPSNVNLTVNGLKNPDTGTQFYVLRHSNAASTTKDTTSLSITTADGSYTIPKKTGTSIEINGQESKFLVANYALGSEHLVYSTSNLFTHVTQGNRDTALFYGGQGSDGETVLRYATQPTVTALSGNVTSTYDPISGDLRLNYTHDGSVSKVLIQQGGKELLLLLTTDITARTFWRGDTGNGAVLVQGSYLLRTASTDANGNLALQGDNEKATPVEVFGAATGQITWNGVAMETAATQSGSYVFSLSDPAAVTIPQLSNWKFSYETHQANPNFNDSAWISANRTTTNNPTKPSTPTVLYADDYGFHHGMVWYRGHFTASGNETGITLDGEGGDNGAYAVWLNGSYLGSSLSGTKVFSFPSNLLNKDGDNVVAVMVQNMGHDEDGGSNDSQKSPRGLAQASFQGSSTSIAWKIQGNQGGETLSDPTRGVMNAGGLFGENNGWALPGFPNQSWSDVSLPDNWSQRGLPEGVAWYRTSFNLNFPTMSDVPLGLNISDSATKNYRSYIYVNGWLVGQYINNLGPQHLFSLPPGVLNPNGNNDVAIMVWALDGTSTGLGQISLQGLGNYAGGVPVQVNNSPDYAALFPGGSAAVTDNAVLSLSSPSTTIAGGQTQTITGVLTNNGTSPIQVSSVNLNAPVDWTVTLTSGSASGSLLPGKSQKVLWNVTPPSYYPGYLVQLSANATYTDTKTDKTSAMLPLGTASISSTAVSGITLDKSILHLVPGTTMPLIAVITPSDAYNKAVKWSTTDPTVATVDQNGNVTGVALGNAVITAKTEDGGYSKSADITVQAGKTAVTGVTVNKTLYYFASDYFSATNPAANAPKTQLIASILPDDATNTRVTWTSDNPTVASVDLFGVVTGLKEGKARISSTTLDGGYTTTTAVYVPTVSESFENQISGSSWNVTKGSTAGAISAAVGPASGVTGQVLNFTAGGTGARSAYKTFATPIANSKVELMLDWNVGAPSGGTGQLRIQDSSHNTYVAIGVSAGATSRLVYTTNPTILAAGDALTTSNATQLPVSGFNTANATYRVDAVLDTTAKQVSFTITNAADAKQTATVTVPYASGVNFTNNFGGFELYATRNSGATMAWNTWIDNFNVYKLSLVNKTALNALIATAQSLNSNSYTPASWTSLQNALTSAVNVNKNANATQDQVDAAASALQTAVTGLQVLAGATLTGSGTANSGQPVTLTYGLAGVTQNTFAQDITFTYDPQQLDFVSADSLNNNFMIVDKVATPGQVRLIAASVGTDHKSNGNWLTLTFRAKSTQSTTTSVTVSNVVIADDAGVETTVNGTSYSVQITAVDKTALSTLITSAQSQHDAAVEGMAAGQYPAGSKAVLQSAIDSAKAVLANAAATQADVTQAVSSLTAALQTFANSVVVVDTTALRALIADAQGQHDAAVEGTAVGQHVVGSKATLQTAIDSARAVLNNAAATQADVTQAVSSLTAALNTFKASVVQRMPGDVNGDSTISIGDLALVAVAYGKTSADADWDQYKVADINGDGVIDILDLAAVAKMIFEQ
ncbi:beta-galactosidase [Paenibacillus planticolens]|uniref:beta-galactosidase n=1 Tax=Paenibacillus planticolens TaxID=2654976 RepID=A0ABX1ZUI6_9BACL|nr:beta-galactosidase [Paenibacillus planticolens]NOV03706.1 cellulase family glycosylhydrolase [Paenibacillus planticolens]